MNTYKIQRDTDNHLIIEGFVTYKELEAIKRKMEKRGMVVEKLPVRKYREITLFDYDYE